MDYAIRCSGIGKTFRRPLIPFDHLQDRLLKWRRGRAIRSVCALHDVSFTLRPGEWIGIYGPNGSGKTTLLKVIAGLLRADEGRAETAGTLSSFFELGIGFHPELRARENLRLHGLLLQYPLSELSTLIDDIIDFSGIGEHASLPLKCYSTGMRLRLAFAAASRVDADIYLFDEVFSVGDAAFQEQCARHLHKLRTRGKSGVLVSHNLGLLQRRCDRVLFLDGGRVVREEVCSARERDN